MSQIIRRTVEFKLYLNKEQTTKLTAWLGVCCWLYNQALEQRIKSRDRRKESVGYNAQCGFLVLLRSRIPWLKDCPSEFARSALRRLDHAMQAFFRRVKAKENPGFPRFRSRHRYDSMECLVVNDYLRDNHIRVPNLGLVPCRGINQDTAGKQKLLRIVRRASGWYAQIVFECTADVGAVTGENIGIDVGLDAFATLSTGEKIKNPRFAQKSEQKKKRLNRSLSRKKKGSKNRRKAIKRHARHHEKIAAQRRSFAHQESRKLVNRFSSIAYEDLNIAGLSRTRLAKSILDAAWGQFICFIVYKAEYAGKRTVAVDPRGTSQTCPSCGEIQKKTLNERVHQCSGCGLVLDRDHAAALVIRERAAGVAAAKPVERPASASSRKGRSKSTL